MPATALSHDPIDILIRSDAWGTRNILNICATLPNEQFHRTFAIGPGSLHATLTHIISVMRGWTDRLAARPARPRLHAVAEHPHLAGKDVTRTPAELLVLLDEAEKDLMETAARLKAGNLLASTMSLEWPGENNTVNSYTFTRGCVLVHVTTHGYHHRAQCLNMLRHLGAPVPGITKGLPEPAAVDWQAEVESPPQLKTV